MCVEEVREISSNCLQVSLYPGLFFPMSNSNFMKTQVSGKKIQGLHKTE